MAGVAVTGQRLTRLLEPKIKRDTQFLAWDGEGISRNERAPQSYVVFGHSGGGYVRGYDLSTTACLDLLLATKSDYSNHTFVGFATNYDVNMICRDIPVYHVQRLWKTGKVTWNGYHLRYIPGKMFNVSRKGCKAAVLYDVFTFFGMSFVRSLEAFRVGTDEQIQRIEQGKARRGSFTDSQLDSLVIPYWKEELSLLVQLCEALRLSLTSAGIHLRDWYGPGAVANQVLNRHKVYSHKQDSPEAVVEASANAYAGGRFEQFKIGRYVGKVYQYDIRSAYPASIARLPSLRGSEWTLSKSEPDSLRFYDLCRIRFPRTAKTNDLSPSPFHWRYRNGNVAFPNHVDDGWHYGSVVEVARRHGIEFEITEWYQLQHNGERPFAFVADLYEQRAEWKKQGNPAQYAAKISLNSLYGKFAQQVGATDGKPPKFHQLEWAGMVTAQTRARIFDAIMQSPEHIIACETDSVFSSVPLDLPIGTHLGEWELTEHDEIIYLQSGVYFTQRDRHISWKYRGMDKDGLSYDLIRQWLRNPELVTLQVPMVRFMGMGGNLHNGNWCRWIPITKTLDPLSLQSKRIHNPATCPACANGLSFDNGLHPLVIHPLAGAGRSATHTLAWRTAGIAQPYRDEILGEE